MNSPAANIANYFPFSSYYFGGNPSPIDPALGIMSPMPKWVCILLVCQPIVMYKKGSVGFQMHCLYQLISDFNPEILSPKEGPNFITGLAYVHLENSYSDAIPTVKVCGSVLGSCSLKAIY